MLLSILFVFSALSSTYAQTQGEGTPITPFSCAVKALAMSSSAALLPGCRFGDISTCETQRADVFDALKLASQCKQTFVPTALGDLTPEALQPPLIEEGGVFVAAHGGNDRNTGNKASPVATVARALDLTRNGATKKIVLLEGTHRVPTGVELDARDAGLVVLGTAESILASTIKVSGVWTQSVTKVGAVQVTLTEEEKAALGPLSVLFLNGAPAFRARYPNLGPGGLFDFTYQKKNKVAKWNRLPVSTFPLTEVNQGITPLDNANVVYQSSSMKFNTYRAGYGGQCRDFFQASYFCNTKKEAQELTTKPCVYDMFNGVKYTGSSGILKFKNPTTGYFNALHFFGWGMWTFPIASQNSLTSTLMFKSGGFQEARGDCSMGGGDFFLENYFEYLDAPNEFFLDLAASTLYYIPTADGPNPLTEPEVVVELSTTARNVLRVVETTNVVVRNVHILGGYPSHLDQHEVPSGGDFAITRSAALYIENSESIRIQNCNFSNNGGNGLMVSRHARNIFVEGNVFYDIGANAIVVAGDPDFASNAPWFITKYPRYVNIRHNVANHVGMANRQGTSLLITLGKQVNMVGNVFYLISRGGIMFNDGFGQGHVVEKNLLFELVHDTSDSAPINAWDRQPYLEEEVRQPTLIRDNFLLGRFSGAKGVDLDDGAFNYRVTNNVIVWGFQKLKGSDIVSDSNMILYPTLGSCAFIAMQTRVPSSFAFTNNYCVSSFPPYNFIGTTSQVINMCSLDSLFTANNTFYALNTKNAVQFKNCANKNIKFPAWQATKQDSKSKMIMAEPSFPVLIEMIKQKLTWVM